MEDRWSHISKKCFHFIAKRLELVDLIRVSCVCQTWNSLAASLLPPKLNPWLIVPYGGYKSREGTVWDDNLGFFNLSNNTVYKVRMPEIVDRRICGSCRGGWLITLHENGEIQLLHPFSKDVIDLPPITTLHGVAGSFIDDDNDLVYDIPTGYGEEDHRNNIISTCIREFYIFKAIMSSHNSRTGIVMAIHGLSRHLAFCRPGKDKIWSSLKGDVDGRFTDITYYEGKFYAVQNGGSVFVVDGLDTSFPSVKLVLASPTDYSLDKYYLIESLGELLWISRTRYIPGGGFDYFEEDPPSYKTSDFRVKKLVVDVPKWVDVSDLGNDRALFVGYNDSFSLSTSDLPGCKGNSIYFTDDNLEEYTDQPFGGHDIGVFHLKYGYVDECYPIDSKLIKPPPVWFTTSTITSVSDCWLHLPDHLYHSITKRLELVDLIRFSCVCQTWKSLTTSLLPPKLNPWLIVPYGGYKSREGTVWDDNLGFFNLSNQIVYKVRMPEIADRRICGSCRGGWLITLHENGEIQLLHPFSKDVIDLPPITTLPGVAGSFIDDDNDLVYDIPTGYGKEDHRNNIISTCIREFYIFKAMISSHNSTTGIVMAIHGLSRHLAFCRPGKDQIWSSLKGDVDGRFTDITFYKGKFYAVQNGGSVFVVDGLDTSFPFVKLVLDSPTDYSLDKYYLIESLGELLWIRRTRYIPGGGFDYFEEDPPSYKTSDFRVKKLVVDVPKWVDVSDLGNDRALFVGYNDSFSLSTSDFPGCKGNSIYFTDDNLEEYTDQPFGGHDIGVFHLKYGYVDECYPIDSKLIKPPPVWFTTKSC